MQETKMNVQRGSGKADNNASRADFWKMLSPDSISNIEASLVFCSNLAQYDWKYVSKKHVLVPFTCEPGHFKAARNIAKPQPSGRPILRWEKHPVWIVDGILHRGESNVLARRRFYLDEESWQIVYGEGFDNVETIVKCYMLSRLWVAPARAEGEWYPVDSRP
jgi:hypothetical protein